MKSTRTPRYQKLLKRLKAVRRDNGITQEELARRLGKPQSFVSKYENGERRLDVAEYLEIASALGINVDPLLRNQRS
ncbi:MAG: transcriptional regulator [Elusimicrobia bacterium RIFCSPLOWO2_12_FULL_59_9]|nr:MAG: transcriptional regulator [Elusimicrobia bacterium RIFCSPLOWO2_12_FULL_59_9]